MAKKTFAIAFVVAWMLVNHAVAQSCLQESAWQNQSGSILHLEDIDSEGKVTGLYINRAAGYGCQNSPYPLTGWVLENTNTITFTVKWENTSDNCKSLTSWTGFFNPDCTTISTLWQLVVNGSTSIKQIYQGADNFTKLAQKTSDYIQKKE